MSNIQGGTLEFDVLFNSGQIDRAFEETKRRVQGFSDATVAGGAKMEAAYNEAARYIQKGFETIGNAIGMNETAIANLQKKYNDLGTAAAEAFAKGNDNQYRNLTQQQTVIQQEIAERKKVVAALNEQDAALVKHTQLLEDEKNKIDNASNAQVRFRTQLMNVKNEMMKLQQAGKTNTEEFRQLTAEATRLQQAMNIANKQVKILANPNQNFQGIIQGLSGISAGFTVANGAIALFGSKNEDLQKTMMKIQALMSITMGLQSMYQLSLSTSAFRLTTLTKIQNLYSAAVFNTGKAFIKFGVSAGVARIAAQALMATLTLGLGVAITAAITLISKYISKQKEAKKATEEFNKKVAESAAKPIATINELSIAWKRLGNDMKAKEQFIDSNKDKFNSLGVSVKNAADAEKLLIENKDKFIASQILKAKALAATELATEKYKLALLKQEEGKNVSGGSKQSQMRRKVTLSLEAQKFEEEAQKLFEQAANFTAEEQKILAKIGQSANNITEGSITALEKNISKLKDQYQNAATDLERSGLAKQIQEQEKILAKMDLLRKNKNKEKEKDPVVKELEEKKKAYQEYFKWLNAGYQNEAKQEFSTLLESGKTYKEYLQNKLKDTTLSLEQIHEINNRLAEETQKTVMQEFEKGLQDQMNNARSVLEMLNVIEQKRKDLETDESGLKEQKTTVLDKQEEDVVKKAEEETRDMLRSYSDYLDKKINREIAFNNQMHLLKQKFKKSETDEEREKINNLMKLYEEMYDAQIDSFEDLEQINADSIYRYGTFEQKRLAITKEYEKLIKAARIKGHEDVAKKLEGERDLEIMKEMKQYKEFFGDVSEISIKTLENTRRVLLSMMKAAYEAGKITAEQYKQLINDINKQADSAYKGRGMESIFGNSKTGGFMNMIFGEGDLENKISSFKNMFSGAKGDMASMAGTSGEVAGNMGEAAGSAQGAAGGAAATLAIIDAIIKGVYQTLRAVSDTLRVIAEYQDSIGNSDASDTLGDWADTINAVNETAMSGWENLKSGNVMGAISDTISMPFKLLTTLNRIHDKDIEKKIQNHAKSVRELQKAYSDLERQVDKALGSERYTTQKSELENLKKQQAEYAAMADAEREKKKSDASKIEEYENAIYENGIKMLEIIDGMREDIIGGTAASIASDLGNAFIDAFAAGENAADAWGKKVDDIVGNIVRKMIIQKFIEPKIGEIVDRHTKNWVNEDGTFAGEDVVMSGAIKMGEELKDFGENVLKPLSDALNQYYPLGTDANINSLSGAIKGASQESIDLLAGQTNAVRVNQVEGIEIMRNSLIQLTMIKANTSKANEYLEQIEKNTKNTHYDPLRSQGITTGL
jgi:hypothetical protein